MSIKGAIALFIAAWGCPFAAVGIVVVSFPNPNRPITDFPTIELTPASITTVRKADSRADWFELWIQHADGRSFVHRDPEPAPIQELRSRIPDGLELRLVYQPSLGQNVLLQIAASQPPHTKFLSFNEQMSVYAYRRFVVYVIAGIWFTVGTLFVAWICWPNGGDRQLDTEAGSTED